MKIKPVIALEIVGIFLIFVGLFMIYSPVSLIFLGIALVAYSEFGSDVIEMDEDGSLS